jgi:hypothetical protein
MVRRLPRDLNFVDDCDIGRADPTDDRDIPFVVLLAALKEVNPSAYAERFRIWRQLTHTFDFGVIRRAP